MSLSKIIFLLGLLVGAATLSACSAVQAQQAQPARVFVTATPTASAGLPSSQNSAEQTASHVATALPTPTSSPTPRPTAKPSLGQVMVLEYHSIGDHEDYLLRSAENFRAEMEYLRQNGYTPANLIEMAAGFPNLSPGQKPVVITFDDSDISQFRYLDDGSLDPDSAVGILYDIHQQYPAEWPLKATFYVLQDVNGPQRILFGQPEFAAQKLNWLVEQGFEVGSHTISHFYLEEGDGYEVQYQLGESQRLLEELIPGYKVRSFAVPFGSYPLNLDYLREGVWDGRPYTYDTNVAAWGGPSISPHDPDFDPYDISRVVAEPNEVAYWFDYFEQNPELYYTVPQ